MITVEATISTVRAIVVDKVETGVDPFYTRNELIDAIAFMRQDFFGRMPEAFAISSVVTSVESSLYSFIDSLLLDVDGIPLKDSEGEYIETIDDEQLDIYSWAFNTFCHGVAYHLMMQRAKDKFYRAAADSVRKVYMEG